MVRITKIRLIDRLFIIGPPGIGKTEIIRTLAEKEARSMGRTFVDLRTADENTIEDIIRNPERYYVYLRILAPHVFPEDLQFPRALDKSARWIEFVPPKYFYIFSLPNIMGVLFIDEITNVQRPDQQSMWFSIILEKEVGWGIKLSRNIKIVAAGNPPEISSVANALPAPLINRMFVVPVSPPDVKEWIHYMSTKYGDAWDRRVAAYLAAFPDDIYRPPKDSATLENFPTPRSWTKLALLLHEFRDVSDDEFVRDLIIGAVGSEVGAKFVTFIMRQPPKPEEILETPSILSRLDVETKYLALSQLAQHFDKLYNNGQKLFDYLKDNDSEAAMILLTMLEPEKRRMLAKRYTKQLAKVFLQIDSYISIL